MRNTDEIRLSTVQTPSRVVAPKGVNYPGATFDIYSVAEVLGTAFPSAVWTSNN